MLKTKPPDIKQCPICTFCCAFRLCNTLLPNLASFAIVPAWLHLLSPPGLLPHPSRWLRPVNHGFTLQTELFRQVLCEAALSSSLKLGHALQMLHSHVQHEDPNFNPPDSHTGRLNVQVCVSRSHPAPVSMPACYTVTLASAFALLTQIKLVAGIDLSGTLARVHILNE